MKSGTNILGPCRCDIHRLQQTETGRLHGEHVETAQIEEVSGGVGLTRHDAEGATERVAAERDLLR